MQEGPSFLAPGPFGSPPSSGNDLKIRSTSALSLKPDDGIPLRLEQCMACSYTGLTQPVTCLPLALIFCHLSLVLTLAASTGFLAVSHTHQARPHLQGHAFSHLGVLFSQILGWFPTSKCQVSAQISPPAVRVLGAAPKGSLLVLFFLSPLFPGRTCHNLQVFYSFCLFTCSLFPPPECNLYERTGPAWFTLDLSHLEKRLEYGKCSINN